MWEQLRADVARPETGRALGQMWRDRHNPGEVGWWALQKLLTRAFERMMNPAAR